MEFSKPILNPEEFNEDIKNYSSDQIKEFERIRIESAPTNGLENIELYDKWCKSYEKVNIQLLLTIIKSN